MLTRLTIRGAYSLNQRKLCEPLVTPAQIVHNSPKSILPEGSSNLEVSSDFSVPSHIQGNLLPPPNGFCYALTFSFKDIWVCALQLSYFASLVALGFGTQNGTPKSESPHENQVAPYLLSEPYLQVI